MSAVVDTTALMHFAWHAALFSLAAAWLVVMGVSALAARRARRRAR